MAKGKQRMSSLVIRMGLILSTATQSVGREGGLGRLVWKSQDSHLLVLQEAGRGGLMARKPGFSSLTPCLTLEQSFHPSRNILGFRSLPVTSHLLRLTWFWG